MGKSIMKLKPMYSFLLDVMKTLAIYEIKDGKLCRLWAFPPTWAMTCRRRRLATELR